MMNRLFIVPLLLSLKDFNVFIIFLQEQLNIFFGQYVVLTISYFLFYTLKLLLSSLTKSILRLSTWAKNVYFIVIRIEK